MHASPRRAGVLLTLAAFVLPIGAEASDRRERFRHDGRLSDEVE